MRGKNNLLHMMTFSRDFDMAATNAAMALPSVSEEAIP